MRIAAMVVGLVGSFVGFFIATRNVLLDAMLVSFSDGGSVGSLLLEATLSLLYLGTLAASVTVLLRLKAGTILLIACTVGVIVFGGLELYIYDLYLYLNVSNYPQDLSLFASPFLYPITAAPFLLVASVLAFLASRVGERSVA